MEQGYNHQPQRTLNPKESEPLQPACGSPYLIRIETGAETLGKVRGLPKKRELQPLWCQQGRELILRDLESR